MGPLSRGGLPARFRLFSAGSQVLGRLGLLHCRTRIPTILFLGVMVLSSLQRLILMIVYHDRLEQAPVEEILQAMLVGLRFDVVVAGMLVAPLLAILPLAPPRLIAWRPFKIAIAVYAAVALGLTTFLLAADGLFFGEFGVRLNHQVVNYLPGPGNEYLLSVIWNQYPVLTVLGAALVVATIGGWMVRRVGFADEYNVGPLWQAIAWPLVLAGLVTLGIRGSLSSHAINTGPAYFSASPSVTQLALNGLFTLRQAIIGKWGQDVDLAGMYPVLPDKQVDQRLRDLVFTERDDAIADAGNPLHRITPSARPRRDLNVVVVVLESLHWAYVAHLGGQPGLTPNLDALAEAGVFAESAYAVGSRTERGFAGIVSSFPDLPRTSVTTREEIAGRFLTLPGVLKERGYQTLFIYGGPAHRDHRQTYLASNGVDRLVVEDQLPVQTFRTALGFNDRDLFQSAVPILNDLPEDRPFFALMLTLTFHRPYDFPGSAQLPTTMTPRDRFEEAVRFSDAALGQFMDAARQQAWFDHTIFVFVADHSGGFLGHRKDLAMNRIPLVFYGPGIDGLQPRRVTGVRSQMDVAPTIMGLLGGRYEHCFFGADMLDEHAGPGLAVHLSSSDELIFYSSPERATIIPPNGTEVRTQSFDPQTGAVTGTAAADPADVESAVAAVQLAARLFHTQRYNVAAPRAQP